MVRPVRLAAWLPILVLFFAPTLPAAQSQTPKQIYRPEITAAEIDAGVRRDWYGVYLEGTKIGYFTFNRERTTDGVQESFFMSLKIASLGTRVEARIASVQVFDAAAPHALLRGGFSEQAGNRTDFTFVRTAPGVYDVTQTTRGNVRKRSVKFDYSLADSMAIEVWIRRGPELGAEMTCRELAPKEQKLESQTCNVKSLKATQVNGVELKYYEILSKSTQDNVENLFRFDSAGRVLSSKVGSTFDLQLESEAEAKNTNYGKDLFIFGMAKVDRMLGDRKNVSELIVDVEGPSDLRAFIDGPRQKVQSIAKTIQRVEVGKRFGKSAKATPEEIEENTSESSTHHIRDPKVKELARQAVGDARTDAEKVRNLVSFVHRYIKPVYEGSQPNVFDLMERHRGDCKAYALLFTNLARASGLPAREVMGLLYVGDHDRAFGGHAWNEVVLDGVWVPIDATFDETEIDATHLCFGTVKEASHTMLEALGKLKVKVVAMNGR
jgi:protein-glutamine gamma-glutamyltransferase